MEELPEQLVLDIFERINGTKDRNSISLVCKRFHAMERDQRNFLKVGCGLHPAIRALTSLCIRFPNLLKVEIVYSGWMSNLGMQLDNQGLLVLASHCRSLTELTLSFCSFINDTGISYLASCENLRFLKLNFAPAVSSNGIQSLAVGCKKLSALHLIRCMKIGSLEWLEYLGNFGKVEDLVIKNCRAIGVDELGKLGPGWANLTRLEFEVDAYYTYPKVYNHSLASRWQAENFSCNELKELSLTDCVLAPGRGLSCVLGKCKELEKLNLDMCIGVKDSDMVALSRNSKNLKSISLRLPCQFVAPAGMNELMELTDDTLRALEEGCSKLEVIEFSFSDGDFPSISSFTQNGLLSLISKCSIRVLSLSGAYFFNDIGMEALCSSNELDTLELVKCQEISDRGMELAVLFPSLRTMKICKCLGVTDEGLKPLVNSHKLDYLNVEDCPQISGKGVQGAARSVTYKQDLSWLY